MELILAITALCISILSPLFSYITIKNNKKEQKEKRNQYRLAFLENKIIMPTKNKLFFLEKTHYNADLAIIQVQFDEILNNLDNCMEMFNKENNEIYKHLKLLRNYCSLYATNLHHVAEKPSIAREHHSVMVGLLNQLKELYGKELNKYHNKTEKLLTKKEIWQWKL
jgi:hypothetical protein